MNLITNQLSASDTLGTLSCSSSTVRRWIGAATVVAIIAAPLLMSGCNTTKGAGKDIEAAGEGIQDAAD
ncbi:MAG: entericidin A/B family lipoprotein [Phycisphaerae bacterium]|nr:entericidin A/B family lipoprotein [Phycisphaerae bacterium]